MQLRAPRRVAMSFAQRLGRLGAELDAEVKQAVELATQSAECEKRLLQEEARPFQVGATAFLAPMITYGYSR